MLNIRKLCFKNKFQKIVSSTFLGKSSEDTFYIIIIKVYISFGSLIVRYGFVYDLIKIKISEEIF